VKCECGSAAIGIREGQAGHSNWCPASSATAEPPAVDGRADLQRLVEETIRGHLEIAKGLAWRVRYSYVDPTGRLVTVQE
jgi:hypothetical protein